MPTKPKPIDEAAKPQADPAVAAYLRELKHPLKKEIEAVRLLILGVSPSVREGIKWNSPSFRTTDWFATLNLRGERVWLILHTGAKVKESSTMGLKIADPADLLEWLAKDRAVVKLSGAKDLKAKGPALRALIRKWIRHVR